jgi:hypothetical protein
LELDIDAMVPKGRAACAACADPGFGTLLLHGLHSE